MKRMCAAFMLMFFSAIQADCATSKDSAINPDITVNEWRVFEIKAPFLSYPFFERLLLDTKASLAVSFFAAELWANYLIPDPVRDIETFAIPYFIIMPAGGVAGLATGTIRGAKAFRAYRQTDAHNCQPFEIGFAFVNGEMDGKYIGGIEFNGYELYVETSRPVVSIHRLRAGFGLVKYSSTIFDTSQIEYWDGGHVPELRTNIERKEYRGSRIYLAADHFWFRRWFGALYSGITAGCIRVVDEDAYSHEGYSAADKLGFLLEFHSGVELRLMPWAFIGLETDFEIIGPVRSLSGVPWYERFRSRFRLGS